MKRFLNERTVVLFTLCLIAVALFQISTTFDFSDVGAAHSPVFFPQIILGIWIALALIALIEAVMKNADTDPLFGLWRLALLVPGILIYTNVITEFGFFLSSAVFAAVSLPTIGVRNPIIILIYSVVVPGALVILFNHILSMPLPTSPFSHLF